MITSDSQVACWCCKYKYNFLRPITAIHNADPLGNSAIKSDSNWESLLCTPAHPDYPAGHCAFSASAAKVLQDFFGSDEVTADVMYPPIFGMTRHWDSFSEISKETNNARVWAEYIPGMPVPTVPSSGDKWRNTALLTTCSR